MFFTFTENYIEQHIHCFVALPSAIFQQLSQNLCLSQKLNLLSKELFQVHFTVFQGIEIFPFREFWKDGNKWKSEDNNVW